MTGRYMMATRAFHKLGDISRDKPDLAYIDEEHDDHYIGQWVAGFGYINVRFPKESTRDMTDGEVAHYRTQDVVLNGHATPVFGENAELRQAATNPTSERG